MCHWISLYSLPVDGKKKKNHKRLEEGLCLTAKPQREDIWASGEEEEKSNTKSKTRGLSHPLLTEREIQILKVSKWGQSTEEGNS